MSHPQRPGPRVPWWLEAGPDTCEFCLHGYHVEAGYYCFDCDAPVCALCVVARAQARALSGLCGGG